MNNVLICASGGVAAYKLPSLCRLFTKSQYNVKVILTENAAKFVSPFSLEILTKNSVFIDDFSLSDEDKSIRHIELGAWADSVVIAPATANTIAKLSIGIADNLLTSTILALDNNKPVYIFPSMNSRMYQHPMTQKNLKSLKDIGYYVSEPLEGDLACGDNGIGKMPEPEDIFNTICIKKYIYDNKLKNLKILVTAGATIEPLDPVRYISNHSSGKMGVHIAEAAAKMGAEVLLIAGNIKVKPTVKVEYIKTAEEMLMRLEEKIDDFDILIMAAAIADYKVKEYSDKKIKKSDSELTITLIKNPDILSELNKKKRDKHFFVGFAAESNDLINNAAQKLALKNLDMLVANDISRKDIGFDSDDNEVIIFFKNGDRHMIDKTSKEFIAENILLMIAENYQINE